MGKRVSLSGGPTLTSQLPWWLRLPVRLTVWSWRHPRTTGVVAGLSTVGCVGGRWALAGLVVVPAVALAVWRVVWPVSFRRLVTPRVLRWHRRWVRYGRRWNRWMLRCRLVAHDMDRHEAILPGIRRVEVTPATDRLLVDIPAGLDIDAFRTRASQLANATRSMACRVRQPQTAGLVWLEFQRRDALAALVPALPVPTAPASAEELRADLALGIDFTAVRVGIREDGNAWTIPLLARHVLVAGRSRSGKGSVLWSVLRELAPAIRVGLVKATGIDPKGGMELQIGKPLFHRYEADQVEAMVALLEREADDMDAVARSLAGDVRKFTPSLEHPLHLVVIDELATLTAYAPLELRRRAEMALGRLQSKGAAVGWVVFGCVQEPTKDIIPMRGLFTYRIALCLDTPSQVDMVLGDDMRQRGAPADEIPLTAPGTGYVVSEFERDPFRVRAAYVDDNEIRDMAGEYAPITDQLNDIETPTPAAWPGPVEPEPFTPDNGVPVVPESLLAKLRTMPAPAGDGQAVNDDQAESDPGKTGGTEAA